MNNKPTPEEIRTKRSGDIVSLLICAAMAATLFFIIYKSGEKNAQAKPDRIEHRSGSLQTNLIFRLW